jgi:hypothetical protein
MKVIIPKYGDCFELNASKIVNNSIMAKLPVAIAVPISVIGL